MSVASAQQWWAWEGDDEPLAPLALDVHIDHEHRTVTVFGELDAISSRALLDAVDVLVEGNPGDTTIDVGEATFIDAGGLGGLVTVHSRLTALGASLNVVGANARQRRLFDIVGLSAWLDREPAVDQLA
jgi:anti-sigma B factor antagonist